MVNSERKFVPQRVMDVVTHYVQADVITVKQLAHPIVRDERTVYNWLHGRGEPSGTELNVWLRDQGGLPEDFRFHLAVALLDGSGFTVGTSTADIVEAAGAAAARRGGGAGDGIDLMDKALDAGDEVQDVTRQVHAAESDGVASPQELLTIRAEAIEARQRIDEVIKATEPAAVADLRDQRPASARLRAV